MDGGLSIAGFIFVILAWGSILTVTLFCFWKVLKSNNKNKL
jgi:hypothetical protein